MGLIKAGIGAIGGVLADQWKEYFQCDAIPADVLAVRGQKHTSSRSSNTKGNDNVISDGSGISVADGQCMIIVEGGKVVEFCAEPGIFTYRNNIAPSLFTGKLGDSIKETFKLIGKRFTYGGDVGNDQRVYYFNTKEITGNKFGTPEPVMFRVVDSKIGLDIDVNLRCNGEFSYKLDNPILFYTNVCGNITEDYKRSTIDSQLKAEFMSALQKGLATLSDLEIRPNQVLSHTDELEKGMNAALSEKWGEFRGIKVVSIGIGSVTLPEEDKELIQTYQKAAVLKDPTMAAARSMDASATAMENAASNSNGAAMGFMGMGMAMNAQNQMPAANLYAMGAQQQAAQQQAAPVQQAPVQGGWQCDCGQQNTGKFCSNCGKPKPDNGPWKCECGQENTGKFCSNCGKPKA